MKREVTRAKREEIYNYIKGLITDGQLKPGDKVPTMINLGKQFSCSHNIAKGAFDTLKDEGILVGFKENRGKGTFVSCVKKQELQPKVIANEKVVTSHLEYKIRCEVNNIKVTVVPEGINNFQIIVQNV